MISHIINTIHQKDQNKNISGRMKYALLPLSIAVSLSMLLTQTGQASSNKLGDLEIYQAPKKDSPTLTMMLDTSGSMGLQAIYDEYGDLYATWRGGRKYANCGNTIANTYAYSEGTKSFNVTLYMKACPKARGDRNSENDYEYQGRLYKLTRLSILQKSLLELLTTPGKLDNNIRLGMGHFSYNGDNRTGVIDYPALPLDFEQRKKLAEYVAGLEANGGTPIATAYADAGAYMMGTTTKGTQESIGAVVGYRDSRGGYVTCVSTSDEIWTLSNGKKIYQCGDWSRYRRRDPEFSIDNYFTDIYGARYYYADAPADSYSGFPNSAITTKNDTDTNYIRGAQHTQCAGNGVYLLTDGYPSYYDSATRPLSLNDPSLIESISSTMNISLQSATSNTLNVDGCDSVWSCMFNYAEKLNNPTNPSGIPIQTATVGFGKSFEGLSSTGSNYNCDTHGVDANVQNLCKLGKNKGKGGFYYAKTSDDIAQSVSNFLEKLSGDIDAVPSGSITIPNDPLSSTNLQPYAYLPMIEAKVSEANYVWPGNLKKYNVYKGTLFGKSSRFPFPSSARLYVDNDGDGFPDDLSKTARDLWSSSDNLIKGQKANDMVQAGGVYAKLKAPNSSDLNSTRKVFVESTNGSSHRLVNIKVEAGEVKGFELLDSDYGVKEKLYLLSFLGYDAPIDKVSEIEALDADKQIAKFNEIVQTAPSDEIKVLGGVVHSKPRQVSYGATFTTSGEISSNESDRDDYIMFGSMDGALHLVKSVDGSETFAFIPKLMVQTQAKALQAESKGSLGQTVFGVDGPWNSRSELEFDFSATPGKVKANKVMAYGGLRMGGKGVYGLNITNKNAPRLLFAKTNNDTGFSRLGQVWSEPTIASISMQGSDNKITSTDVVIVSGGYDSCYEDPNFVLKTTGDNSSCDKKTMAEGNAVYILNAETGAIIASISGAGTTSGSHIKEDTMLHSVVGGVTALDRDDDGNVDHLYYADLGGNVYRVDLNSGVEQSALIKRVVRIFHANPDTYNKARYRFYERPIVSFYTSPSQEIFASITVASGDRSSPLSMLRSYTNPNKLFNLFDYDIAQSGLYGYTNEQLLTRNKTPENLVELPFTDNSVLKNMNSRQKMLETIAQASYDDAKSRYVYTYAGWSYPLKYFDGYSNVNGLKAVGEPLVYGNRLYTTVYSPEMVYDQAGSCSAQVVGGSERQLYCMPYGICTDTNSDDGTGGYIRAGKGIQELALGAYSKEQRNVKLLIGSESLSERVKVSGRHEAGEGSGGLNNTENQAGLQTTDTNTLIKSGKSTAVTKDNGKESAQGDVSFEIFKLIPKRWYEQKSND